MGSEVELVDVFGPKKNGMEPKKNGVELSQTDSKFSANTPATGSLLEKTKEELGCNLS